MARGMGGQSPSNVAHYLSGIDFPCQKEDLVEHPRKNNADTRFSSFFVLTDFERHEHKQNQWTPFWGRQSL
jgi:hypothetical protein